MSGNTPIYFVGPKVQERIQEFLNELKEKGVYELFIIDDEFSNFYNTLKANPRFKKLIKFTPSNFLEWSITNDLASELGTTNEEQILIYANKLFCMKDSESGFKIFSMLARATSLIKGYYNMAIMDSQPYSSQLRKAIPCGQVWKVPTKNDFQWAEKNVHQFTSSIPENIGISDIDFDFFYKHIFFDNEEIAYLMMIPNHTITWKNHKEFIRQNVSQFFLMYMIEDVRKVMPRGHIMDAISYQMGTAMIFEENPMLVYTKYIQAFMYLFNFETASFFDGTFYQFMKEFDRSFQK